ncbi:MAG TPA: glycosyltransferase family 2 protein [Candidatus Saccharimonadales bacterium]|jgi:glycosyltransferase involved in cell wall biosynthesis
MYRNHTVTVCLPCRNEARHLRKIIRAVPSFVDEIIVISNVSTDDSVAVARAEGVVALEDNRTVGGIGYGFAHATGIAAAHGDIIVGLDADGTYPVEDLADAIDYMLDGNLDFVSCARLRRSRIPFKLRLGVTLLNAETRLLYGMRITDILSGMWVFTRTARGQLILDQGGWNLSPQIKIAAATNPNIRFAEYQIAQKQRYGTTHQHYFRTGFLHAQWILASRVRSQRPWLTAQDDAAL